MQREKMEYKPFKLRHNATQSGRGRATEREAEKDGQREWRDEAGGEENSVRSRHLETHYERWWLDQPIFLFQRVKQQCRAVSVLIFNHKVAVT